MEQYYKKQSFKQLKEILLKEKLTLDEELLIRTIMKDKIIAHQKTEKVLDSLVKDIKDHKIKKNNRFLEIEDERYNLEIKKDKLNNNLTDRMNNEFHLITAKKGKVYIESPYDNVEPINKTKLTKDNVFKKVKCASNDKKDLNNAAIHSYSFNNLRPKEPSPLLKVQGVKD